MPQQFRLKHFLQSTLNVTFTSDDYRSLLYVIIDFYLPQHIYLCFEAWHSLLYLKMKEDTSENFELQLQKRINPQDKEGQHSLKRDQQKISKSEDSKYFKTVKDINCESFEKLKKKLEENGVYQKKTFNSYFQKTILSKNGNSYTFEVSVGHFESQIHLLKINMISDQLQREIYSNGAYSSIFVQQFEKNVYAIKAQKLSEKSIQSFDKKFDQVLEEYFINKIASILQFGPKLINIYGYDIVFFYDSIQFSMELCLISPKNNERSRFESDLLIAMKTMHSLQIVHSDIKVQNISWSESFHKWVLIDFGLASSIQEKPGEKTNTFFRGTYSFTSKEMQNLYRLQKQGFVDLYQNDLHGLNISKVSPIQQQKNKLHTESINVKSSLFQIMIHFCRMKLMISFQKYEQIGNIFTGNLELKNEFLGLLLIELQTQSLIEESAKKKKISQLYSKFKHFSCKEQNEIEETDRNEKYQYQEKMKCFKLFTKQEVNHLSLFMWLKQNDLRKIISKRWGQFVFLQELFIFFQQTLYSNSQIRWRKMKLITNIIIQLLVPNCEQASWTWKFHRLLLEFENIFLQRKFLKHLREIFFCYYFFNDRIGWERLNKILLQNELQKDQILNMFCSLYDKLICFGPTDSAENLFCKIKICMKQGNFCSPVFHILERITQFVLYLMSSKVMTRKQQLQFQSYIQSLQSHRQNQYQNFVNLMIDTLKLWKNKFLILYPFHQKQIKNANPEYLSPNKYFALHKIMQKLNYLMEKPLNILQPYFQAYPILKEIPEQTSFSYYFKHGNHEKLDQISRNIFLFNESCLDQIVAELDYFHNRLNEQNQKINQKVSFLNNFLKFYHKRMSKHKNNVINKFWKFYFMCLKTKNIFKNKDQLKKQVIQSLQSIINFYNFSQLSKSNQVYIYLFISTKKFLSQNAFKASSFLENIQKSSLISIIKENQQLLIDFISASSFYSNEREQYSFHKTLFEIFCSSKILNWLFYEIYLFFQNTIVNKTCQKKPIQAINIINSYTQYLTSLGKRNVQLINILLKFIKKNSQNNFQIMMHLIQTESFPNVRSNNYSSSFLCMIYLEFKLEFDNKLSLNQIRRIYTLSVSGIDKLPHSEKIILRRHLKYNFRVLQESLKCRKKRILDRQQDYARHRLFLLKREFLNKIKKQRFSGKIQIHFKLKLEELSKNLREKHFVPSKK